MGHVFHLAQELETFTCWAREGCGVQFAIPATLARTLRTQGGGFYCPKGHHLGFGESDLDKARKERDNALKRLEWAQRNAEIQKQAKKRAEHARAIAAGKLKAQSQRVKVGVCPCCNRTFKQLARHMACKHPNWAVEMGGRDG